MVKKVVLISLCSILLLSGCTRSSRLRDRPAERDIPVSFVYVSDEGNGYFKYQSFNDYFLVSRQRQGSALGGFVESNVFIDIIYDGAVK